MDIVSYLLGKEAGGGGSTPTGTIEITQNGITNVSSYATADVNVQPDLESKSETITTNTTTTITPTQGKDGLSSVEITTNVQPNLETKEITITENTTTLIEPTSGKDGLSQVSVITNVSGGDDWSDIGYSSTPETIEEIHTFSKYVYDNWPQSYSYVSSALNQVDPDKKLVICPLIDTSKDTNNSSWFMSYSNLIEIPAIVFKSRSGTYLFAYCGKLAKVDLSNFNTSSTTNMTSMFNSCTNLTSLDLSSFNTSNVTNMQGMFSSCTNLTTINFGSNFNTSKVANMQGMFSYSNKLDDNTLNAILNLCINATSISTNNKKLSYLGITNSTLTAKVPTLSNYQDFLDAGWTIS